MNQIKEIWCMHHSHLDIGYTHPQPMLLELQGDYIEQAIMLCEQTKDYPEEARFRWTCEVTWPVINWLKTASEEMTERFIRLIREKRISIAALPFHTTPGCTGEQLLTMMKGLDELREVLDTEIDTAINHDINGQPWPMSQVLLDSGVSFYMTGINIHFGGVPFQRPSAFWWKTPDGRKLLSFVGEHYSLFSQFFHTWEADTGVMHKGICDYIERLSKQNYQWDFIFLTATNPPMFDNNCPDAGLPDLIKRYNEEKHEYTVRFATPEMLREKLLSMGEEAFPVYGGDWTDYWNFGSGSTARETKVNRLAARTLESAGMVECMTGWKDKRFEAAKKEAQQNALFYEEHTWGASQAVSDPQDYESLSQLIHKQEMAYKAADLAGYVLGTQMEKLADNPHQSDSLEGIVAVNPTGITQEVSLFVPKGWMREERQLSGIRKKRYIPYLENEAAKEYYANEEKEDMGKITVPPFSCRLMSFQELRKGKGKEQPIEESFRYQGNLLETPFYTITLSEETGGVKQIFDKQLGRKLIDEESPWGFFEPVRETIDSNTQKTERKTIFPRDVDLCNANVSMWNHQWKAARTGTKETGNWQLKRERKQVIFHRFFKLEGMISAEQRIAFYEDTNGIDLSLKINKEAVYEPEGIYLVIPLLLKEGWKCIYDTAGQFVRLDEEQLGAVCRDWVTVEKGIALYDENFCCGLACPHGPLVQVGDFNFGRENRQIERRKNPILAAWPLNNYWDTNFAAAQRDTMEFSYRLFFMEKPDIQRLEEGFIRAENRCFLGAVADMERAEGKEDQTKKCGNGLVRQLIAADKEGIIETVYPAKKGGFIAVLRNKKREAETVNLSLLEQKDFIIYEVDVQEKVRNEIMTADGKAEIYLESGAWKLYRIINEMQIEGDDTK